MTTLFRTLVLRPLARDPLRTLLTTIAVALGVAIVIGIELAGDAAAGSFESSLTTVLGRTDLEITANGGLDERVIGRLTGLAINARFAPVIETQVLISGSRVAATLYGVDLVELGDSIAVSNALARVLHVDKGSTLALDLPTGKQVFRVERLVDGKDSEFLVLDIATAQHALGRYGKLDRIEVFAAPQDEQAIQAVLPPGAIVNKPGARAEENQRMLHAFRWNLRVLSYISLVVGAFLIYNTISISVVRRRPEIGILRAIGASRGMVLGLFLLEAVMFGLVGAALGVVLGRAMAEGLVGLIASTVNALYVSSKPAPVALTAWGAGSALLVGLAVALLSAFAPAREAMRIAPTEAMARGSRETSFRRHNLRNFAIATLSAIGAYWAGLRDLGYLCCLLSVVSAAFLAPGLTVVVVAILRAPVRRIFGADGLLAARGLTASLGRTSVVVAALATATSVMVSVGIMVGSFRETVVVWLDAQLRADLYIHGPGPSSAGILPPMSPEAPAIVRRIPGVTESDVLTALEIRYEGQRAAFGGGEMEVFRRHCRLRFLEGDCNAILRTLPNADRAIVTQPFSNKHHLRAGDRITIALGSARPTFTIAGVYYDYSNERGWVMVDRSTLHKYLPDQPPTSMSVYVAPGRDATEVARAIKAATVRLGLDVAPNAALRRGAMQIFDRTFAVTWALEGVAIVVAMLGSANSLLALVLDRRREFGLLRYLGAAPEQIRRMVLVEAGLVGMLANLLGVALGFALSLALIFVINVQSFGWTIQFHPPVVMLAGALLLVWCVTIVSGIYPARVAVRVKAMDVVHEE